MLEIDAYPERLDLKDEHVRKAIDAGVQARHRLRRARVAHLRYPDDYGIAIGAPRLGDARRTSSTRCRSDDIPRRA